MCPDQIFYGPWKLMGASLCYRHKAIIAYLNAANLPQSCAAFREELGESISVEDSTLKKYEGLLEKKWTSVVRLQKKVGESSAAYCILQGLGKRRLTCGGYRLWTWRPG